MVAATATTDVAAAETTARLTKDALAMMAVDAAVAAGCSLQDPGCRSYLGSAGVVVVVAAAVMAELVAAAAGAEGSAGMAAETAPGLTKDALAKREDDAVAVADVVAAAA